MGGRSVEPQLLLLIARWNPEGKLSIEARRTAVSANQTCVRKYMRKRHGTDQVAAGDRVGRAGIVASSIGGGGGADHPTQLDRGRIRGGTIWSGSREAPVRVGARFQQPAGKSRRRLTNSPPSRKQQGDQNWAWNGVSTTP